MIFNRRTITKLLDLVNLQRHNDNYADIQTDLTNHEGRITGAQSDITTHKASTAAHPAEHVTYEGEIIGAENIKEGLDIIKTELDQAIISGDSGPEAAASRYNPFTGVTHATLPDRLNEEWEQTATQLADITYNPILFDDLKVVSGSGWDYVHVLQATLDVAEVTGGTVILTQVYDISSTIKVPSNVALTAKPGSGVKLVSGVSTKIITNKDTVNGNSNLSIRGLYIEGNSNVGAEQSAGIHLVKCTNSIIADCFIVNTRGDGITLGNITDLVSAPCSNVSVKNCVIKNAYRQGIALTDAEDCAIESNVLVDLLNGSVGTGIGVDLEPNFSTQLCRNNRVLKNFIHNCKGGIYLSSVANVVESQGNILQGNIIKLIAEHGIKSAYPVTTIIDNTLSAIGKHGIIVGPTGVTQIGNVLVDGNTIVDAGISETGVYSCVRLENTVHSIVSNNIFRKEPATTNKVLYAFSENTLAGQNSYKGNHARSVAVAYSLHTSSKNSHNHWDETQVRNVHEGFSALGDVLLNGNKMQIGVSPNTANIYHASGVPSTGSGTDGDIVFVLSPALGTPVGYKKVSGNWYPFGQIRYSTSISSTPDYVGQEALVSGIWYKSVGVTSSVDWKQITN
ncbi:MULTISPECIES: right-handed parallel beta-helix repeat-containing protein [unclassified Paenibacillus]|uniref:right-handed parallel beta-helix repeat-containing protein n=1 Tax=unclassified Paenibacillus TaxID=185978 RepID=UPI0030FB46F3